MATIKIIQRLSKIKKNGEAPLYIRITKNRRTKFISLQVYVVPKDWDSDTEQVKKSYPESVRVNRFLAQKRADAISAALDLETSEPSVSSSKIKQQISGTGGLDFIQYANSYLSHLKSNSKVGTHDKATAVISKLKTYLNGTYLSFSDLTVTFLHEYQRYLKDELGNSTNTVHSNLKVIRRIINQAIDEELFPFERNPFHRFKLKWEKPKKEFLIEDEINRLEDLDLPEGSKLRLHRDMFIIACYVGGLRISDLVFLKRKSYDGERILIYTEKTNELVNLLVMGKAKELVDQYATDTQKPDDFVFPCFQTADTSLTEELKFKIKSSVTAHINTDLKKIATRACIDKRLTFHTARHTYATWALRKGLRPEHVQKLMGHASIKTTMQYAKIVNEDLDNAMRKFYS